MDDQRQPSRYRFGRWAARFWAIAAGAAFILLLVACGGSSGEDETASNDASAGRSSGASASSDDSEDSDDSVDGDGEGTEAGPSDDATTDSSVLGPELSDYQPTIRPDGLELVFADGALGPAELGSTIDEITAALGAGYEITPEESIRVDFPAGYSISREGEVLFFAIEEDGIITVFMTQHERVGLDGGLRPRSSLEDAIAMHGEPSLTLGPEGREFVSFADGTGGDGAVSVLVAIGQFGGPVGVYDGLEANQPTEAYQLEEANIKELWFWAN